MGRVLCPAAVETSPLATRDRLSNYFCVSPPRQHATTVSLKTSKSFISDIQLSIFCNHIIVVIIDPFSHVYKGSLHCCAYLVGETGNFKENIIRVTFELVGGSFLLKVSLNVLKLFRTFNLTTIRMQAQFNSIIQTIGNGR